MSLDARRVYFVVATWRSFAFTLMITVNLIWQVQVAQLSPLQLVLVGVTLEAVTFLGEVPTGVLADLYGRRLSVIVGFLLLGVGWMLEGLFPVFAVILVAQVVWGIGDTFISGALDAWLADEVGEAQLGPIYLRAAQLAQAAGLAAIPFSVGLGNLQLNLPILAGAGLFVALAAFCALRMPETNFWPALVGDAGGSVRAAKQTLRDSLSSVRGRPILMTMFAIIAFQAMAGEGIDRLYTPHLLFEVGLPGGLSEVTWFGIVSLVAVVLAIAGIESVRRWHPLDPARSARLLLVATGLQAVSTFMFALAMNFPTAVGAYLAGSVLRRMRGPIFSAWLNRGIDSRLRATVLSMAGQADAAGQILGAPLVGMVASLWSIRAGLVVSALALAPATGLYVRAHGPEPGRGRPESP